MSNTALNTSVLIQATALNRYYGDYQAVSDFNLTLNKGEILGLLGPNGAGKSTTIQMLTGNISPSSGEVFINGISLIEQPESAKSTIGYLPEQPPVYRDMTVSEYLIYCAALRSISKPQRKNMLAEASERCGLQDVHNKLIGNLSKGFQQRVGIAQAILHKPKVVILDEPTVGLDPIQINQIRQLIRELGEDHAVILSTHILPEVQAVCDRVQIINRGETVFSDSFDKLADRQSTSEVIVSFANDVDVSLLNELSGVEKVEALTSQPNQSRYQISYQGNNDTADIFQLAVKQDWNLLELSPQTETLEQIFMNLIHSESASKLESELNQESAAKKPEARDE
ncbi:MAG: ABC transporter ATP-binding protein [Cocleimonas sp.]